MKLFTGAEFLSQYPSFDSIADNTILEASEMVYAQVSPCNRNSNWDFNTVPEPIKNACMEQARFLMSYEIPHIDTKSLKAGAMQTQLMSEYSTLALTMLANAGYLYRGNPINYNMSLDIEFGG